MITSYKNSKKSSVFAGTPKSGQELYWKWIIWRSAFICARYKNIQRRKNKSLKLLFDFLKLTLGLNKTNDAVLALNLFENRRRSTKEEQSWLVDRFLFQENTCSISSARKLKIYNIKATDTNICCTFNCSNILFNITIHFTPCSQIINQNVSVVIGNGP